MGQVCLGRAGLEVRSLWLPGRNRYGTKLALALGLTLLMLATGIGFTPNAKAGEAATVSTDALYLREDMGLWAGISATMVWGDRVDVLSGPHAGNWYEVRYNGVDGYASGDFLSLDSGGGGQTASWSGGGATGTAWINTDFLNLRTDAGSWADVLTVGVQGESVTTLGGEVGGYLPVEYQGQRGWMWAGYLAASASSAPAGPERWIDVDRSSGIVTLYLGNESQYSTWGAMGFDLSNDGYFATANGTFYVYSKNAGLTWTDWGKVYITNWVAFDPYRQNGFHSYSLDANGGDIPGGSNPTGGCIALPEWAADVIYQFARVGTRVEVHW